MNLAEKFSRNIAAESRLSHMNLDVISRIMNDAAIVGVTVCDERLFRCGIEPSDVVRAADEDGNIIALTCVGHRVIPRECAHAFLGDTK